jgi:environmental stress-induced protein Ves
MTMLIPYASLDPVSWKNGGGSTIELAINPADATLRDFDWRISLATIAHDGPFSVFPGVDRTLALVSGPGVTLEINGERRFALCEDEPVLEFTGESNLVASVGAEPTTDFNVMTRRERCHHKFGRRRVSGRSVFAPRGDMSILFLAEGDSLSVSSDSERIGMVRFDTIVFDTDTVWTLEVGRGVIFIVDIFFI